MALVPDDIEWDDAMRRNRKGRSDDYFAFGATDGGRRVVVVVAWQPERRVLRPITAWEQP